MIGRIAVAVVAGVSALLAVTSASAVPNAANVQISILVGTGSIATQPPTIPNGGTANVPFSSTSRASRSATPGPTSQQSRHSSRPPTGLRWGADGPDPSEDCTEAVTTVCQAALGSSPTSTTPPRRGWNVVADAPGSYTVRGRRSSNLRRPTRMRPTTRRPSPSLSPNLRTATAASTAGEGNRQRSSCHPRSRRRGRSSQRPCASQLEAHRSGPRVSHAPVRSRVPRSRAPRRLPRGLRPAATALRNPRRKDPPWNDVVQRPRDEVHEVLRREARPAAWRRPARPSR